MHRIRVFLCSLVLVSLLTQRTGFAANDWSASTPFSFLDPLVSEATARDPNLAVARAAESEREAAVESADAGNLPTLGLSAQSGPSRTWQWNESGRLNPNDSASWNTQAGINLRQNLWAGGRTALRSEAARTRFEASRLDTTRSANALTLSIAQDVARIVFAARAMAQQESIFEQARKLEGIASRKNQSGFLGKKELLDTQRETLRSDFEARNARLRLAERIAEFNRTYHLKEQRLTEASAQALAAGLERLASATAADSGSQSASPATSGSANLLAGNLDLRSQDLALKAIDVDVASARRERLAPSLDLQAGLSGSLYDNGSIPRTARAAAPDRGLTASGQLTFSINLFSPASSAAAEEALARKATALASRARTEDALLRTEASLRAERALLAAQLTNQKVLLALTEDLLQKNTRLFEAGAFDVLDVIASQQAVARDRQALVDLEGRLQQFALRFAAARVLGVFDAGAESFSGVGSEAVR